jgi:predicted dehydrogenase
MKAAIIGTGFISGYHAEALQAAGIEIGLAVNHHLSSAETFAKKYHCKASSALNRENLKGIDAVHICTPPDMHAGEIKFCLQEGKHVLCEKPLSLSYTEAEELSSLAEASGVMTAVNFNNRFYASVSDMKEQVYSMQPVMIHGHYFQEFHLLPCPYSWRYLEKVRALTEIGSHLIDLMRYTTGLEAVSVSTHLIHAMPDRVLRDGIMYAEGEGEKIKITNEDAAVISMKLSNGAIADLTISEIAPGCSNDIFLEAMSLNKSVSWSSESPYEITVKQKEKGSTSLKNSFAGGFRETFTDTIKSFYTSIQIGRRDPRLASFKDAAVNAAVIEALYESGIHNGKEVMIREKY